MSSPSSSMKALLLSHPYFIRPNVRVYNDLFDQAILDASSTI